MSWHDVWRDERWWYDKRWAVYEPGYYYDRFVCYCYGEYEAREWEWDGYLVCEPSYW